MNHSQTTLIALGVLAAVFFCLAAYFWSKSEDLKDDLAFEKFEHGNTKADLRDTEAHTMSILRTVVPLVEKTDWMTGRWGGQFSTLVSMENARNRKVEAVRKHLMSLPMVTQLGFNAFDPVPEHLTPEKEGPLGA